MTIDSVASVVTATIQELTEDSASDTPIRARDMLLSRLACHASVRRGDKLSTLEINALAKSLDEIKYSSACPHGRPISVALSVKNFSDWFARTV
jgi:DNA mismatch repair protein MutL